jgi:DNA polymerase III subunit delta'
MQRLCLLKRRMLFKEIIGQDLIKSRLIDTVSNKRISHAQLLLGPEGCGKLALAIAYAQYINCENKQENDSCGECDSCRKFSKLIHPDLHFIFPNSTTKSVKEKNYSQLFINEFRELLIEKNYYVNLNDWYTKLGIENKQGIINTMDCGHINKILSLKSYESEYTIIIIWMIEKLFYSAAPKILKILEEPPDKTLFLLISEDHEQIINTIKSRAQLIKIPKLNSKDIEKALTERYDYSADIARKVSKLSDGNFIESLQILDNTDEEKINFVMFRDWMRLCYKINISELNKFIDGKDGKDGIASIGREKQKQFFNYALNIFRETLNFKYQQNYLLKYEEEELTFVKNLSSQINESNIYDICEEFNKALYHIERNANPKILFMDLSLKIYRLLKQKINV